MRSIKNLRRRALAWNAAWLGATVAGGALAVSMSMATASAASAAVARHDGSFSFALVMRVSIHGMPRNTGFDLFVIQQPLKPFGVSWYQTDVNADFFGNGSATVRGIFDAETFSVSPGGTTTFAPTHQYHLGLWFNNPRTPFRLGCEPGAMSPIVTPFNGEQNAGIQALNTSEFPDNAGPLSHVHR